MSTMNFENSAMKSSFSLSSLPISETPDKNAMKPKEFNSLKKKRKESTKRQSWGSSTSEHKDDFWSGIEANYNYIMDNQLIDNCQDANCELSTDTSAVKEFHNQFSELYSWLNSIQEEIYGNEDNLTDKKLRAHCKSEFIKKRGSFTIFTEQAKQLIITSPESKDEVNWWVYHISTKWDSLETVLKASDAEHDDTIDVQRELKCLKNWLRDMELRLKPLEFHKKWSKTEIDTKLVEHKVLHKDIENHGKIVKSVLKLCKRTSEKSRNTLDTVTKYERRWQLLVLRSLEWQCYIENLLKKNSALFTNSDSDEGPVKKQPRLSSASPIFKECHNNDVPSLEHDIDTPDGIQDGNNENEMLNPKEYESETRKSTAKMAGDNVQTTKTTRTTSNNGYFCFKYGDMTDSDIEKMEHLDQSAENELQTTSETSDEDWTYTANKEEVAEKQVHTKEKIWKIVKEVEEMVSPKKRTNPTGKPPMNKMLRIKQWLEIDKPDDSCDASSENDESDDSQSSEELNESIATYRPQTSLNASCIDLGPATSTPKLRQRYNGRGIRGQRPSSIACITQLSKSNRVEHDTQPCSISESAIHKLPLTTKMSSSISMQGNNSTSSTVEDSCALLNIEHNSPLRKKRFKLKKKATTLRKNESASPYNNGVGNRDRAGTLVKSGSFSGRSCLPTTCDRQTVSDPIPMGHTLDTSTTSGADSDDDKRQRRLPLFKLGAKTNYVMNEMRDDSPGKFSLNTNEEQSSSLCDEAWDNYQEKYSSEPYSEAHDSDAARRLLEFGEDYRTYLGSQSDWSAQSSHLEFSPQFPRKFLPMKIIDSDNDNEANDLRQLLKDSRDQLKYTENVFEQQQALGLKQFLVNNDLKELMTTCDRHIKCLTPVDKSPEEYSLSMGDKKELADLIASWQALKGRINIMQEFRDLQNEILVLKRHFCETNVPGIDSFMVSTIEELSRDIDLYSAELAILDDHKKKLQKVNFAVSHFMAENTEYNDSSLKSDVAELYRIWHEINNSATERVKRLKSLLQNWEVLETRLDQLRGDLRDDEQTLGDLDLALQGGNFSNKMASSVRDIAKLLSETKTEGCSFSEILTEGSFSDSGISDEGSEHELGKRERRLSAIRRLVRQLEIVMAPDCIARIRMRERLEAAEEELKTLRNKCRSIIVRTAVSAAAPLSEMVVATGPGGDPDEESNTTSWFKRAVRAASYISFSIALLVLLLVAYPEPSCCDNVNNLQMSLNPQLHYTGGRPI